MTEVQFLKAVEEAVQKTSLDRIKSFSQFDKVSMEVSTPSFEELCKKSLVVIILAGPQVHKVFKIFFDPSECLGFLKNVYSDIENSEDVFDKSADFFKEVANLVAGHMKKLFETSGISSEISLPILLRGYDSLFFENRDSSLAINSSWKLELENSSILCQVQSSFKNLDKDLDFQYESSEGEIEFF